MTDFQWPSLEGIIIVKHNFPARKVRGWTYQLPDQDPVGPFPTSMECDLACREAMKGQLWRWFIPGYDT